MRAARWLNQSQAWKPAAIGVLAVLAIVFAVLALTKSNSTADATHSAPFHTVAPIAKHPTAVFVGGVFTEGLGASAANKSWPELISHSRGWKPIIISSTAADLFSLTSVCPAAGCTADSAIVSAVIAANPRIVVFGAEAEAKANQKTVTSTADATIRAIQQAIPRAYIIVVGPVAPPGSDDTRVVALDSALRSISSNNSATYVSLVSPTGLGSSQFTSDDSGPNDAGQAEISQRIQASLSP